MRVVAGSGQKPLFDNSRTVEPKSYSSVEMPKETDFVGVLGELVRLSKELSEAITQLRLLGIQYAEAEREYQKTRAKAILTQAKGDTVAAREASIEHIIADSRYEMTVVKSNKETELENVRSLRQTMSALQTVANSMKSEADALNYGQGYGA